ncbi:uncharacterized protein BO87DRAFT_372990 [Aspergillus neoniger CBS 115656]|uniref:Uncharacterized protein n=1 Tax=Aspergillus neoniger (strain CBS 115656) TaxID=1448310 RepID=A0A318YU83_ASPNB|nr:hypothetical protein BO87DRAFT_372990 [Aspergillus neoniger CBS 115656]PYH38036.1 hypothetical protein BO87DRAFT_372990 [Aspergillus neoniger CBS 115656]
MPAPSTSMSTYNLPDSASLALTELYPPRTYRGINDLNQAIMAVWDRLRQRDADQFLSFKHISPSSFLYLENNRNRLRNLVRLTYYPDIETMIVKVPLPPHEKAHQLISSKTFSILDNMGIDWDQQLPTGSATHTAASRSQKQGDFSSRNSTLRPNEDSDWPNWIIEAGLSESLRRLRQDINWWIGNSGGQVLLALLVRVDRAAKKITIEKYFPQIRQGPSTRAQTAGVYVKRLVTTTVIDMRTTPPSVQGGPLVLDFDRLVGRPAVAPETNVIFDNARLVYMGRLVFMGIP